MTRIPTLTLFDLGRREDDHGKDLPTPENKLIEPYLAIQWVATGSFSEPAGPRVWYSCLESDLIFEGASNEGRRNLALEIIVGAIGSGVLRCAFITESAEERQPWDHAWGKLSIVDPQVFKGASHVSHDWDSDGLGISISNDADDDDTISFSGFWLFWDEVQRLRPAPRNASVDDAGKDGAITTLLFPNIPAAATSSAGLPDGLDYRPLSSSGLGNRRGKGRPAGKNGEPIAMFVLRVQASGVDKLNGYTDDALGAILQEEYGRLGLKPPENTNAARDARGVLRALVKMQAKKEGPQEA